MLSAQPVAFVSSRNGGRNGPHVVGLKHVEWLATTYSRTILRMCWHRRMQPLCTGGPSGRGGGLRRYETANGWSERRWQVDAMAEKRECSGVLCTASCPTTVHLRRRSGERGVLRQIVALWRAATHGHEDGWGSILPCAPTSHEDARTGRRGDAWHCAGTPSACDLTRRVRLQKTGGGAKATR